MLYPVGSRIDLRELNSTQHKAEEPVRHSYETYQSGTKISFLKMVRGLTVMDIIEPPIALRVAVGA